MSKLSPKHQFRLERKYRRRAALKYARPKWTKATKLVQWGSIGCKWECVADIHTKTFISPNKEERKKLIWTCLYNSRFGLCHLLHAMGWARQPSWWCKLCRCCRLFFCVCTLWIYMNSRAIRVCFTWLILVPIVVCYSFEKISSRLSKHSSLLLLHRSLERPQTTRLQGADIAYIGWWQYRRRSIANSAYGRAPNLFFFFFWRLWFM